MDKQKHYLMVDYDMYETDSSIRQFVLERTHAVLVAIVENSRRADPDTSSNVQPDWDIVIRNNNDRLTPTAFRVAALSALSALPKAVAVTPAQYSNLYLEAGTLVAITSVE